MHVIPANQYYTHKEKIVVKDIAPDEVGLLAMELLKCIVNNPALVGEAKKVEWALNFAEEFFKQARERGHVIDIPRAPEEEAAK